MQKFREKRFKSLKEMRQILKIGDVVKYNRFSDFFIGIIIEIDSILMGLFVFKSTEIRWLGFQEYAMEHQRYTKLEF